MPEAECREKAHETGDELDAQLLPRLEKQVGRVPALASFHALDRLRLCGVCLLFARDPSAKGKHCTPKLVAQDDSILVIPNIREETGED